MDKYLHYKAMVCSEMNHDSDKWTAEQSEIECEWPEYKNSANLVAGSGCHRLFFSQDTKHKITPGEWVHRYLTNFQDLQQMKNLHTDFDNTPVPKAI